MRTATLYHGHALDVLAGLPERSVHCCVTSPPYWGLRDYKLPPQVWDGEPGCLHEWALESVATEHGKGNWTQAENGDGLRTGRTQTRHKGDTRAARATAESSTAERGFCRLCGAWRGSLGLEPSVQLYVRHVVEVFRAVWRVLRDDGTLWLNIGDSYAASTTSNHGRGKARPAANGRGERQVPNGWENPPRVKASEGLKPKDLIGVPWRVALALQEDGWYLRSEIIWSKPAPMPESVRDRPTRAHEHIFLLSKSPSYFYDADAVRESPTGGAHSRGNGVNPKARKNETGSRQNASWSAAVASVVESRNLRTVWEIGPEPCPDAHFATFPSEIPRRAILAGTSAAGACGACGAPWVRQVKISGRATQDIAKERGHASHAGAYGASKQNLDFKGSHWKLPGRLREHQGWRPACECGDGPVPCTVLDPFFGSGRSGITALELGRSFAGIDLSAKYLETIARPAIEAALQAQVGETEPPVLAVVEQGSLW